MSKQTRVSHPIYNLLPTEIEGFDSLAELALDMRWSWNHATDEVWRQLDSELWEITNNPWVVLQTVARDRIERVLGDPVFRKNVDGLLQASRQAAEAPAWPRRERPPHRMGHADARKHGAVDAALLRQPHGPRIHRVTLPPGAAWVAGAP